MSEARVTRLRGLLVGRSLDAILIAKPENRAYLSGFSGSTGTLLITAEQAILITDFRYEEQAAVQAPSFAVKKPDSTVSVLVAELCDQMQVRRLGYEGDFTTVDEFMGHRELQPARELVSATGLVESLRMIKDPSEVAVMRQAAAIADEAFAASLPFIKAGVREVDVALELEFQIKRRGATGLAFDSIVASGVRSSLPHGRASAKVIEAGELVTLDFGALYDGYCSDMTRTVMVGEPTERQQEIYAIVLAAQKRGVAACRAGITGRELDEVCRSYIQEHGYGQSFGHGTGHGVGRYIHEAPKVSPHGAQHQLLAGMVVTIEPGIYLPGWGGVRIEDMVLVTAEGCECLSQSPKELIIL